MQMQCTSSLTRGILLRCSGINSQKSDVTYLDFALACDVGF